MGRPSLVPEDAIRITAKSGFMTRQLFTKYFATNMTPRSQLRAWSRLLSSGFFVQHPDQRLRDVFLLNKRNRRLLQFLTHEPVRAPYSGLIRHDEIVLNGVLKIEEHGFLESWITESELRKEGSGLLRIQDQGQSAKYPDAVLITKSPVQSIGIAIEVELSRKEKRRYQQIMNAYSFAKNIELILFVCGDVEIENLILEMSRLYFVPARGAELGFMSKSDWLQNPILGLVKTESRSCSLGTWVSDKEQEQIRFYNMKWDR